MKDIFCNRITIFTGHYGSGKSEVAINFIDKMNEQPNVAGGQTIIVDLDIVNPYFRTADVRGKLESNGIRVIAPLYANTNVDAPALTGEINVIFENADARVVIDVGGDDSGATALGRYREEFAACDYEMLMVVNTFRPFTNTVARIIKMQQEIEYSSGLKITGYVGNVNLLDKTTPEIIIDGMKIIEEAAAIAQIPVKFISGFQPAVGIAADALSCDFLPLDKNIKLLF
jgi:hypothetical protein